MPFYTIHGMTKTNFHRIWCAMRERCNDKNNKRYNRYGERGTSVCERWMIFTNFRDDMHQDYLKHIKLNGKNNTQLDRIDNNGNYCPENCRWATILEQANNKSNNHYYWYKGCHLTIPQLARKYKLNPETLSTRIHRGWSVKRAIEQPIGRNNGRWL